MHRRHFYRKCCILPLALLYYTEQAFSLCSNQEQRMGININPIWHPTWHIGADLELKLVNDWSKTA